MGKIIELSDRLAGHVQKAKLTLRQSMDKQKKTRTEVIEMLEAMYSKYLALGESYKELAAAYQNSQRLTTLLLLHGVGAQVLTTEGRMARDELVLVVDQSIGDAIAGDAWDLTADPADGGHLIVRLRRRAPAETTEPKAAGAEG